MRKKVIFVSTVFDDVNTGPGIYARYLWDAFRDDTELEFHVVAPSISEKHLQLHSTGVGRNSLDTYRRVQQFARRFAQETEAACIVHGNAAHSMSEFLEYSGPWIVQVNDYVAAEVWERPTDIILTKGIRKFLSLAWRRWHEKKVVSNATFVICNSEFTRTLILRKYSPKMVNRVATICKAVDTKCFEHDPDRTDPFPERPLGSRIVFVGTDWRIKGLPDLLDAMNRLVKTHPSIHLTLGGPSLENELNKIRRLIAGHRLTGHVLCAGRLERKELAALYQHSDAFVLPSHKEAFGVSILEAMASGLSVVASNVGGIPEIVSDGVNGLTFSPGDPEQLGLCLGRIIDDADLRKKLVQNGLDTASAFDVDRMIQSVRGMYERAFSEVIEESS